MFLHTSIMKRRPSPFQFLSGEWGKGKRQAAMIPGKTEIGNVMMSQWEHEFTSSVTDAILFCPCLT